MAWLLLRRSHPVCDGREQQAEQKDGGNVWIGSERCVRECKDVFREGGERRQL